MNAVQRGTVTFFKQRRFTNAKMQCQCMYIGYYTAYLITNLDAN